MNNWFGVLNPLSKMMMVGRPRVLPGDGQRDPRPDPGGARGPRADALLRRRRSRPILRKVRVPNALPYFFTALKVGTTLSLIGAIVGEYFGGSIDVLGRVIVQSASALRFDVTWAAIVIGGGDRDRPVPGDRGRWNGSSSRGTPACGPRNRRRRPSDHWRALASTVEEESSDADDPRCPGARGERRHPVRGVFERRRDVRRRPATPRRRRRPQRGCRAAAAELTPVRLQLQWAPQAQFAGYFAAEEQGYYAAAGPRRRRSSTAARTSSRSTVGSAADGPEFTIAWVPKVLEARDGRRRRTSSTSPRSSSARARCPSRGRTPDITGAGRLRRQEGRRLGLRQRVRGHGRGHRRPG